MVRNDPKVSLFLPQTARTKRFTLARVTHFFLLFIFTSQKWSHQKLISIWYQHSVFVRSSLMKITINRYLQAPVQNFLSFAFIEGKRKKKRQKLDMEAKYQQQPVVHKSRFVSKNANVKIFGSGNARYRFAAICACVVTTARRISTTVQNGDIARHL